jgi:PERQ amino acid-rich with GYF domain-containing protein
MNYRLIRLRELTGGHETGNQAIPANSGVKYKLADHRYGREEMLSLAAGTSSTKPPQNLDTDDAFYHGKPRDPLCMEPMTDEEAVSSASSVSGDEN